MSRTRRTFPVTYAFPRDGITLRVTAGNEDELRLIRTELELLRQVRRRVRQGGDPAMRPRRVTAEQRVELMRILADAEDPSVEQAIRQIDRDFPGVRGEIVLSIVEDEAARIAQDAASMEPIANTDPDAVTHHDDSDLEAALAEAEAQLEALNRIVGEEEAESADTGDPLDDGLAAVFDDADRILSSRADGAPDGDASDADVGVAALPTVRASAVRSSTDAEEPIDEERIDDDDAVSASTAVDADERIAEDDEPSAELSSCNSVTEAIDEHDTILSGDSSNAAGLNQEFADPAMSPYADAEAVVGDWRPGDVAAFADADDDAYTGEPNAAETDPRTETQAAEEVRAANRESASATAFTSGEEDGESPDAAAARAVEVIESGLRKLGEVLAGEVQSKWRTARASLDEIVALRLEMQQALTASREITDQLGRIKEELEINRDQTYVYRREAALFRDDTLRAKQQAEDLTHGAATATTS